MKTKSKKTFVPQSAQTKTDAARTEGAPTFQVQTGVKAGGFFSNFYSWWEGVADGFNLFDRNSGLG